MEEDKDKIIDLVQKMKEKETKGGRKPGPLGANGNRVHLIKGLCKQAIRESAHERLTPEESEFASLVVNGASLVEAYRQAYPERCWAVVTDDSHGKDAERLVELLTYEQISNKANHLSKKPDVRSVIIRMLEQEEEEISHTASRLDNFIVKRLEAEASNPSNSAASRIAALKALSEHRAVQTAETKSAERAAATSEEVLTRISERVASLSGGKDKL